MVKKITLSLIFGLSLASTTVLAVSQKDGENALSDGVLSPAYVQKLMSNTKSAQDHGEDAFDEERMNQLMKETVDVVSDAYDVVSDAYHVNLDGNVGEKVGKVAVEASDEINYKILISSAMGEDDLKRLFKAFASRADVSFVIRGLLPSERTINDVGKRIATLLQGFKTVPSVLLDPRPFKDVDAEYAPTVIAYKNNKVVNFARGLANPNYLLESIDKGQLGDLGNFGKMVKISERDITEIIKERAAQLDSAKIIQDAKDNYWKKVKYLTLPEAKETRTRIFEPIITVQNDIVTTEGVEIAHAGDSINTLSKLPFTQRLVFFNATNPNHIDFIKSLPKSSLRTKYITTEFDSSLGWDAINHVEKELGVQVFQFNRDLLRAFDLRVVPSVVTADNVNNVFVINEYAVMGFYQ